MNSESQGRSSLEEEKVPAPKTESAEEDNYSYHVKYEASSVWDSDPEHSHEENESLSQEAEINKVKVTG